MSHRLIVRSKCVSRVLPRSFKERTLSTAGTCFRSDYDPPSLHQSCTSSPFRYFPYSTRAFHDSSPTLTNKNSIPIHSIRYFSTPSNPHPKDEDTQDKQPPEEQQTKFYDDDEDDDMKKRNKSILVNPNGVSYNILPNQMVYKINPKTGEKRKVHQVAIGSFWMVKDLRDTQNKPILSNPSLIPAEKAQLFPPLKGLTSLTGNKVDLPDFFIKHDGTSETSCTLVAISYKDYGFKMLSKWTTPFLTALSHTPLASVVHLTITEGTILKLLSGFLKRSIAKNTPMEQHESTLLHFGNVESFRDVLRMHNTLTGYVVLLDGLGRVRWMGSGEPSGAMDVEDGGGRSDELELLIQSAKQLLSGNSHLEGNDGKKNQFSKNMRKNATTGRVGKKTNRN